jgi:HEPN domain-containing protein
VSNELRDHVFELMPKIDELLEAQGTPIPNRFIAAGMLYVEYFVQDSTFESKDQLLESDAYRECVLPIFNDWYYEKYRDLTKNNVKISYLGVAFVYGQPIELKIPSTTSEIVEEGKLSKMIFPDHMQENEKIEEIIQPNINLEHMTEKLASDLKQQIAEIIAYSRSINIDINTSSKLEQSARNMSMGIWGHFEKGLSDILANKPELSAVACWEFHLAIEKSLKVLIHSKTSQGKHGHCLDDLIGWLKQHGCELDSSELERLPSDKDAIKLRYAEMMRQPIEAFNYYLIALKFVADVCSKLDHEYELKNSSFTLKMAPWAR